MQGCASDCQGYYTYNPMNVNQDILDAMDNAAHDIESWTGQKIHYVPLDYQPVSCNIVFLHNGEQIPERPAAGGNTGILSQNILIEVDTVKDYLDFTLEHEILHTQGFRHVENNNAIMTSMHYEGTQHYWTPEDQAECIRVGVCAE